jgi:hypothetical protein
MGKKSRKPNWSERWLGERAPLFWEVIGISGSRVCLGRGQEVPALPFPVPRSPYPRHLLSLPGPSCKLLCCLCPHSEEPKHSAGIVQMTWLQARICPQSCHAFPVTKEGSWGGRHGEARAGVSSGISGEKLPWPRFLRIQMPSALGTVGSCQGLTQRGVLSKLQGSVMRYIPPGWDPPFHLGLIYAQESQSFYGQTDFRHW